MSETEGDRLFAVRVALGQPRRPLSQPKLAERLGYDASTISRIERGGFRMSREFAEAVAEIDPLKRGAWWLLYGIITIDEKVPADIQAEAEENARRLKEGRTDLITRDLPTSPPGSPRGVDALTTHEQSPQLAERQKKAKKRARRKRA